MVNGSVSEVNESLNDSPQQINIAPESDGWLVKVAVEDASNLAQMMDENAYQEFCKTQDDH